MLYNNPHSNSKRKVIMDNSSEQAGGGANINYGPTQNRMPGQNAHYVREQKGHSIVKHAFLCLFLVGFFTIPYYTFSPNHYWHL